MQAGDRVRHWKFGPGTVRELLDQETVVVDFDTGGRKTLALEHARLEFLSPELERKRREADASRRRATFVDPDPEGEHYPGSHWSTVGIEPDEVMRKLPELIAGAQLLNPLGRAAKASLAEIEPKGASLIWPDERRGVVIPIALGEEDNQVVGLFPWIGDGVQHEIVLHKVHPWSSGLEGQISADLGGMAVTFFDAGYAMCRGAYRAGRAYQFALTGLAYQCEVVKEPAPVFITAPEAVAATRRAFGQDENDLSPIRFETKGMAAFIGVEKYDRDEYQFQGPVKEAAVCDFLGQKLWRLRTTVARSLEDNADRDLAVFVHERHFMQSGPPAVGDDVRGVLWLQGMLLYPGRKP